MLRQCDALGQGYTTGAWQAWFKNVRIKYVKSVRIEIEKLKIKIEKQVTSKAVTFPVASVTKSFSDLKNSRFNH